MPLVAIGVMLFILKLAEFGPVANWAWWWVLSPFAAAAVWWQIADSTGLTQRKAIDKMEKRKTDRRDRALEVLGQDVRRNKQLDRAKKDAAARRASADPTQADSPSPQDTASRRDPTR